MCVEKVSAFLLLIMKLKVKTVRFSAKIFYSTSRNKIFILSETTVTLDDRVLDEKSFISKISLNPVFKNCFHDKKIFSNHFRLAWTKKNYSGRLQTLLRFEILMQCQILHLKAVESYRVKLFSWSPNSQRSNWVKLSQLIFCRKILWNTQVFNYLQATVHITSLARHVSEGWHGLVFDVTSV